MVEMILESELNRRCIKRGEVTLAMQSVSTDSAAASHSFECLFVIVTNIMGYETTKDADTVVSVDIGLKTLLIQPQDKRRIAWYSGDTPPYTVSWDHRLPTLGDGKVEIKFDGMPSKCMLRVELLIVTKKEEGEC
jgi:hypothetical protein